MNGDRQISPAGKSAPVFRAFNVGVLLLYCGTIVLLLVADLWYVDAESFREALRSPEIRSAFVLSVVSSLTTTALAVLVAVPSAYALSRYRFRGAVVLDTVIDMSSGWGGTSRRPASPSSGGRAGPWRG